MKKYKCPVCHSTQNVVKFGYRGRIHRFLCKHCHKHFSINPHFVNRKAILSDHLDGLSFRKLGHKYGISKSLAWEICHEELKKLPDNNQLSVQYCSRFSKVFVFDGKYFNVATERYGYVLLWGVDYFRHDIPVFSIAPSENYQSWSRFFMYFRMLKHHPELLVCDDNPNLKMAARYCFPEVRIQTCYNHFKENIRRTLKIRSDITYKPFMKRVESILSSSNKLSEETFNHWLWCLYRDYQHNQDTLAVLLNIEKYKRELLAYRGISHAPVTNNIIEGLNSHLERRLVALCSFQTLKYAKLWLNGYVLKRRLTPFTDCYGKFRALRGKTGLEMTLKPGVNIPSYF